MFESLSSFENDGLSYRFLNKSDKPFFVYLYTNHEVMRHIRTPYSQEEAIRIFEKFKRGNRDGKSKQYIWTVQNNSDRLGFVGLTNIDGVWDLGIILSSEHLGKGWGPKVMSTLLTAVFKGGSIDKVTGQILTNNKAALGAIEKLGFEYAHELGAGVQGWVLKRENFIDG